MSQPVRVEFILLVALLNALTAMSIDTMLPAIGTIASDLGASDPNSRQFVVTAFFLGMTFGTLLFGPISDAVGRKPTILAGVALHVVGCLLCLRAETFPVLLIGRAVSGFGLSATGYVSTAMVRDGLAGSAMARVMSFVMSVFMLVPILAPSIGQFILLFLSWHAIFVFFILIGVLAGFWLAFRQSETLPKEKRLDFSIRVLLAGGREALGEPVTLGYTVAAGAVFGGLVGYLGTSQQIFTDLYHQGAAFALWFGGFAVALALAMITNARLVMKLGMRRMTKWALRASLILSGLCLIVAFAYGGKPMLPIFGLYLFLNFFCLGLLFGNYNAMLLEPVGHIAGTASAVSGFVLSTVSIVLGALVGQSYSGTVTPLVAGFFFFGLIAFAATEWAEVRRSRTIARRVEPV